MKMPMLYRNSLYIKLYFSANKQSTVYSDNKKRHILVSARSVRRLYGTLYTFRKCNRIKMCVHKIANHQEMTPELLTIDVSIMHRFERRGMKKEREEKTQ